MKARKWLIILLAIIVTTMSTATYTGVTESLFTDDEQSTDDALGIRWGLITLDDGFEGTPWDANWDENGTTTWTQDSANPYSGIYNAYCDKNNPGYLTSDEIDASAAGNITVSFWFNAKGLDAGDCLVQTYNGTTYNTLYDLSAYSTYVDGTWCKFAEVITEAQYLIAGFRLRFDTSAISGAEDTNIDDVLVITDSNPPAAPAGLTATAGEWQVTLDWNDNTESDLAGYDVYRNETGGEPYTKINASLVTTSDYTDTGLTNDVTYYYVVTALDIAANESGYSNEDSATAADVAPAAPTNLVATEGVEQVSLDWDDNTETDLAGYDVYRSPDSGGSPTPYAKINASLVATSDYIDSTVTDATTYYYVVKAVDDGSNESGYSNEDSATPDWAPAAPANLVATNGNEEITLDWDDNTETDLAGYDVYRSPDSGGSPTPYAKINASLVATSEYIDSTVTEAVIYYYVVKAVDDGSNESGYSNEDSATAADVAPAAPSGLVATEGVEQVTLDWDDNTETDLAGYDVYRSPDSGGSPTPYAKINASLVATSEYIDSTVTEAVIYYYVVKAVDDGSNESGYSNEDSATPDWAPAAPANLVATNGNEEITLDWDDNTETDLAGYDVYRSPDSGGSPTPYAKINASLVATSQYTDSGLYGGGTYYYVVKAVDNASHESVDSNEDSATAADVAPAAPANLVATNGNEEITLDWDDNTETDLAGYDVYRSPDSGGSPTPYAKINASLVATSQYTDSGLYGGGTYYYVVKAVDNGANESGYSNEDSATAADVAPAAPSGLVATEGVEQVTLDWDDNTETDLAGYDVYRSPDSGGSPTPYAKINASLVATSEYIDSTVTEAVIYYYVVKAVDDGSNESGYSNEDSATPDWAPAAPANLVATNGNEEITLDWDDNTETDLAGYDVYRSPDSGGSPTPYAKINASLVATSQYTDSGLYGGGTYYYVVKAVDNASHESVDSNEDSATAADVAPAAPANLVATNGNEEITLDWDDNTETDLAGYDVYRSPDSGGSPTPYAKINASLVATSQYTDSGLYGGGTYYYVVKAVDNGANESGYSNEDSATAADVAPAAPSGLVATEGVEQVTLDWDDNTETDLAGYDVYRSPDSGGSPTPYAKINASLVATSEYIDSTVTEAVIYYYVVKAVDDGSNESGYSNEDSATPDWAPAAPANLVATNGNEEITLDWDDNTETDLAGYDVYRSPDSGGSPTPYAKINASLVATSQYTDSGLYGGGTYYYVVKAVDNASHESVDSNEDSATAADVAPAAPANLVATNGNEEITLDWDDNTETDLAGYDVYRSPDSGGSPTPYTKINASLVATSQYTDSGLYGGGTYYYVVKAVDNGANESGYSNEDSATAADVAPAAPSGLVATEGVEQVTLDWDDNTETDLAGYDVYRSPDSGGSPTPYAKINASLVATSEYIDSTVTEAVIYYYVVKAVDDGANESGYSNEASATPYGFPQTLLDDGFEGTPWDFYWDGNGTTDWQLSSSGGGYGGSYSADHASGDTYLTSDDLDASGAGSITVSFWFKIKLLNKGPLNVQLYNGTAYDNWYDLVSYAGGVKNTWIYFSQTTTESQYFISDFSLRFDGSGLTTDCFIDDVLIQKD